MSKKIATVSTVFAACERLESTKERWNRDDVRAEIGGGGYVVIDPLIQAWRAIKPLRTVAPNTPAELLHQVATSLEGHIIDFTDAAEARLAESQQVFAATVEGLSEKLTELTSELTEKQSALQVADTANAALTDALEVAEQDLNTAGLENARLTAEVDSLSGQVARLTKEHQKTVQALHAESKARVSRQAKERSRLADEHAGALAAQRKALAASAEQAENRLMMLLDQARQEAKLTAAALSDDLAAMTQQAQSGRETVAALETTVKSLTRQNDDLESRLAREAKNQSDLVTTLEQERASAHSLAREFHAYKKEHSMSGELGALQEAVLALQTQLRDRSPKTDG